MTFVPLHTTRAGTSVTPAVGPRRREQRARSPHAVGAAERGERQRRRRRGAARQPTRVRLERLEGARAEDALAPRSRRRRGGHTTTRAPLRLPRGAATEAARRRRRRAAAAAAPRCRGRSGRRLPPAERTRPLWWRREAWLTSRRERASPASATRSGVRAASAARRGARRPRRGDARSRAVRCTRRRRATCPQTRTPAPPPRRNSSAGAQLDHAAPPPPPPSGVLRRRRDRAVAPLARARRRRRRARRRIRRDPVRRRCPTRGPARNGGGRRLRQPATRTSRAERGEPTRELRLPRPARRRPADRRAAPR